MTRTVISPEQLRVPKRRVPVQILLADTTTLEGAFYADVQRIDGTQATLLDRLRDPTEDYIPLATNDRHVLVRKSMIVTIGVANDELPRPRATGIGEFGVTMTLKGGSALMGSLFVVMAHAHARALDYLNRTNEMFIPLYGESSSVLVNSEHVVTVTEHLAGD